jgi:hypothetical protein
MQTTQQQTAKALQVQYACLTVQQQQHVEQCCYYASEHVRHSPTQLCAANVACNMLAQHKHNYSAHALAVAQAFVQRVFSNN